MTDIKSIINQFQLVGKYEHSRRYGSGHLHDTFFVELKILKKSASYILQRMNHRAFKNPPALMENIVRVTDFLRMKFDENKEKNIAPPRQVLCPIYTGEGKSYLRDPLGNYWRVYKYIEGSKSYDILETHQQIYQVSYLFGEFLRQLDDFPSPPLHVTIKDFHNGLKRFQRFQKAFNTDKKNRAVMAKGEIQFLLSHSTIFNHFQSLINKGEIPLRISHNDTKVNNVLLDKNTNQGICVIDLDTVMEGTALYDFGDLVRSAICPFAEDDERSSEIQIDLSRFESIVKGFLLGIKDHITRKEIENLVLGSILMTLMLGMRFLTDYLSGDTYFKIKFPDHNLYRCRYQFKLVKSITELEGKLNAIVNKYAKF